MLQQELSRFVCNGREDGMDCAIDWGTVPQWITAVGVGIAIWGIWSQRSIARKRAAIDVFIKTEMDEKMTEAYDKFHAGLD